MERMPSTKLVSLDDVLALDKEVRNVAAEIVSELTGTDV
jgi:hypothetical protein